MSTLRVIRDTTLERLVSMYRTRDLALLSRGGEQATGQMAMRTRQDLGTEVFRAHGCSRLFPVLKRKLSEAAGKGVPPPSLVIWSTSLTAAKGRFDRRWYAPEGGIYLSFSIFPRLERERWGWYTIAAGVSVAQVLREWGAPVTLRWINDVLFKGRKLCGVLAETVRAGESEYLLHGMGVNVNITGFPPGLEATSLELETGEKWPVPPLAAHMIARLGLNLGLLEIWEVQYIQAEIEGKKLPNPIMDAWKALTCTLGREVQYGRDIEAGVEFTGKAVDFAEDGSILIQDNSGRTASFNCGEVRYLPQKTPADIPL